MEVSVKYIETISNDVKLLGNAMLGVSICTTVGYVCRMLRRIYTCEVVAKGVTSDPYLITDNFPQSLLDPVKEEVPESNE